MARVGDTLRITSVAKAQYVLHGCWVGKVERVDEDGTMYGSWGEHAVATTDGFSVVDFPDETIDSFIRINELDQLKRGKYGKEREDAEAEWLQAVKGIVPCVGLPCTICYYSDRRAATVTKVFNERRIAVKHNKTRCVDYYAGDYEVLPDLVEWHDEVVFTKRKNGMWVQDGHLVRDGVRLMLHYQNHYIDPHF